MFTISGGLDKLVVTIVVRPEIRLAELLMIYDGCLRWTEALEFSETEFQDQVAMATELQKWVKRWLAQNVSLYASGSLLAPNNC